MTAGRRLEMIRTVKSLSDLHLELLTAGYNLSRNIISIRLLSRRENTNKLIESQTKLKTFIRVLSKKISTYSSNYLIDEVLATWGVCSDYVQFHQKMSKYDVGTRIREARIYKPWSGVPRQSKKFSFSRQIVLLCYCWNRTPSEDHFKNERRT